MIKTADKACLMRTKYHTFFTQLGYNEVDLFIFINATIHL